MNKTLIILVIIGVMLPNFIFAQSSNLVPQNPEEAGNLIIRVFSQLPNFFKDVFREFFAVFKKVWEIIKYLWNSYLTPSFQKIWLKVHSFLEFRRQIFKEEFRKEIDEMKEDIKNIPDIIKNIFP